MTFVASGEMTGWDWALAGVGLALIAILLVMGAVAWMRDAQAERTSARRVADLVEQVKRGDVAGEPDSGSDQGHKP